MEFIHPYWLFGLLAIAIPIIIHLFNFRRYRKYYFTNLKFLKSIKKETKKQHRLRHLLILISRILAIIFLILAFARPYIPGPQGLQQSDVDLISIYIDNSMSMQAATSGHSLLDEALAKATEVASAYNHSDRFQLITNDFEGKHQPYYNRDEFLKLLNDVKISAKARNTNEIYNRMKELADEELEKKIHFYIVSDFQRTTTDIMRMSEDTSLIIFLMPLIDKALPNVYIDSCWLSTPFNHLNQHQDLHISFVNASDLDLEKIPVRLNINDKQRALASFDIQSGSRTEIKLPFTNREAGILSAEIIIDDYPITWDDRMYLSWEVKDRIPVLVISEQSPGFYLNSLFSNDSVFNYHKSEIRKLDYSKFQEMDFIVLDNVNNISSGLSSELLRYIDNGGSLLLIPSEKADIISVNQFLQSMASIRLQAFDTTKLTVTGLNTGHEIFSEVFESIPKNLDLPMSLGHFPLTDYRQGNSDVIMDLQNSDPYISITKYGDGKLYILASPAGDAYGNLVRHALWVPLIYRMSMLSRPQHNLYYTLGEDNSIRSGKVLLTGDQSFIMKLKASEYEFIPGYQAITDLAELSFYDQIKEAGHYDLLVSDQLISSFAFNYDRLESNPEIYTATELLEQSNQMMANNIFLISAENKPVSQSVIEFNKGTELWKIFIWLALLFILMEILLLRLFKK
jgi:hypothetical protein